MVRISGEAAGEGSKKVVPGWFHLLIEEIETKVAQQTGNPYPEARLTVLAGTVEGQEGKEMKYQKFPGGKFFSLAAAIGLTDAITGQPFTPAELHKVRAAIKAKQAVQEYDFEPAEGVGRQFVAQVVMPKDKPDGFPEVGFEIYSVADPEVVHVPKDLQALAMMGVTVGEGGKIVPIGNGHSAPAPATAPAAQPATRSTAPQAQAKTSRFAAID